MSYTSQKTTVFNSVTLCNLVLTGLVLSMVIAYIFNANQTTDLQYRIGLLRKELVKENLENDQLTNRQDDTIESLISFAENHGMVEVKTYSSFFEESGVALKH